MNAYGGGSRGGIRHAYPLEVTSASFTTALVLNLRTLPYAFVRFFLHTAHALVAIAFFVATIVCAAVVGKEVHPAAGVAVLVVGIVVYTVLWAWWFRYALYAVKCGHIACLTDLITRGKIGDGSEGMLSYGKHVVRERFADVAQVYVLQALIRGVVSEFNMAIGFIADILPFAIPMLGWARRLLRASTRYLDETLFAYSLIRRNEPLWDVCSEGLGYYFQNSKEILKTSMWMMVLGSILRALLWIGFLIAGFFICLPIFGGLIAAHGHMIANDVGSGPGIDPSGAVTILSACVGALIFAGISIYSIERAFLHPIYLTMVMTKFLLVIQTQPLSADFERYLLTPRAQLLRNQVSRMDGGRIRPPPR
ncbi:MAG: hypothetical protein ABI461_13240 [Polyangiaceae bacterium]